MKRAQIELMGLAILIVLVIVGIIFVTRFMANKEPIDYKNQFTQTMLATNMINTFLKTTSDCNELSFTQLIQDCSQNNNIRCTENNIDSCNYVKQESKKIFEKTLETWNIDYYFEVSDNEDNIIVLGNFCPENKKSKNFPIPTSSEVLLVKLDICG